MNIAHIAAHQDDEGFALGTMLKYRRDPGNSLLFICMTNGDKGMSFDPSIPLQEAAEIRDREMRSVAEALQAEYICLGAEDEFLFDSKEIRLKLIEALRAFKTDVLFTHWTQDYNLDHSITATITAQAAMNSIIASVQTESPPLSVTPKIFHIDVGEGYGFEGTHFVELDQELIDKKARIIRLHESQMQVMRKIGPDFADMLVQRSADLGRRAGVPYAEVFRPCLLDRRIPLAGMLP